MRVRAARRDGPVGVQRVRVVRAVGQRRHARVLQRARARGREQRHAGVERVREGALEQRGVALEHGAGRRDDAEAVPAAVQRGHAPGGPGSR